MQDDRIRQNSNLGHGPELALTDGTNSQLGTEVQGLSRVRKEKSPISPAKQGLIANQGHQTDRKGQFGTDVTNCDSPGKSTSSHGTKTFESTLGK